MARNRKNSSPLLRFRSAIKIVFFFVFVCGAGMGYVWQKNQIYELGKKKKKMEETLEVLKRGNRDKENARDHMETSSMVRIKVDELGLDLIEPSQNQILYLKELSPEYPLSTSLGTGKSSAGEMRAGR